MSLANKKNITLATLAMLASPVLAFAAACPTTGAGALNGTQWFQCIITNLLNIVLWPLFITIAIVMFIWAGILFLTAHGEPDKTRQATKAVIYGCIGIVVGILGYVAVGIIRGGLGV